ncbi:MAG: vWA domain-containing protein, partial [Candidatus Geothermarchaeales archaeon]
MTGRHYTTTPATVFVLFLVSVFVALLLPVPVRSQGLCGPMDIAVVLDNTGSMGAAIDNVKAALPAIISDAADASGGDLKLGYVTFSDTVTVRHALTADIAEVQASILAEVLVSGGGFPEASDEAVNTVVSNLGERPGQLGDFSGAWRAEAVKILILITEAEPGGFNDFFDPGSRRYRHAQPRRHRPEQGNPSFEHFHPHRWKLHRP